MVTIFFYSHRPISQDGTTANPTKVLFFCK